jgi:hypothetical protein
LKLDLEAINAIMKGLPESALRLCPDDTALIFLTQSLPVSVSEANAKRTIAILSLVCRKVAINFNELAAEQERLVREWED